jgi:N-methylhydantoinase A
VLLRPARSPTRDLAEIEADFHATYEREYTYRLDAPVEMVGLHVVASAEVGKLTMQQRRRPGMPRPGAEGTPQDVDYALEGVHRRHL